MKYELKDVCSRLSSGKNISAAMINEMEYILFMVVMADVVILIIQISMEIALLLEGKAHFAVMCATSRAKHT